MQIAQKLPRIPSKEQCAAFVHQGFNRKPDSEHLYRPYKVHKALTFLKENNVLYRDVILDFPDAWYDAMEDDEKRTMTVEYTQYTDADVEPVQRKVQSEAEVTGHVANTFSCSCQRFFLGEINRLRDIRTNNSCLRS
jgi:hypothetical protein